MHCFHRAASRLISAPARSWVLPSRSSRTLALPRFPQPLSQYRWNSRDAPSQFEPLKQDAAEQQDIAAEQQDIAAEQQDIAAEQQDIAAKQQDIAAEQQDVAVEQQDIAAEQQDIAEMQDFSNEQDITMDRLAEAAIANVNASSERITALAAMVEKAAQASYASPKNSYAAHYRQQQKARWGKGGQPKETIFVGNLFYDVTADDLRNQMQKYGIVEHAYLVFDSRGLSRGFGYVQFDTIDAARRAIEALHGRVFQGRIATVQFAQASFNMRPALNPCTRTLYIGNLAFEMTDRDLNEIFKDLDNLIDVRVSVDRRTGKPRGFAHAEFTNSESAKKAFEIISKRAPYGRRLRVAYAEAKRNERSVPAE